MNSISHAPVSDDCSIKFARKTVTRCISLPTPKATGNVLKGTFFAKAIRLLAFLELCLSRAPYLSVFNYLALRRMKLTELYTSLFFSECKLCYAALSAVSLPKIPLWLGTRRAKTH